MPRRPEEIMSPPIILIINILTVIVKLFKTTTVVGTG